MNLVKIFAGFMPSILLMAQLGHAQAASAKELLGQKILNEQIGQMIMVGFNGTNKNSAGFKVVQQQIAKGQIGGVMYLRKNIVSKKSVREMNIILAASSNSGIPALIAVDQEGGRVQRLSPKIGFPYTPSAKRIARTSSRKAFDTYNIMAKGLSDLNFNLNFGPVVDLDLYTQNPIIGRLGRSYSSNPTKVVDFAVAFIDAHRKHGLLTSLKHFPGHGSSRSDTHKGFVDITNTWKVTELEPYKKLIKMGYADMVMSGHLYNAKFSKNNGKLPASLSAELLTTKLRKEMRFKGVVISDDLQMGAIKQNFKFEQTVIKAVKAGNDILLFANDKIANPNLPAKVHAILLKAAQSDKNIRDQIARSYQRVTALKIRLKKPLRIDSITTRSLVLEDASASAFVKMKKDIFVMQPNYLASLKRKEILYPNEVVSIN